MANFGRRYLGDGEAEGVHFGEMTDAIFRNYYQNPGFHKPGCRHAGLPESASFFLCKKAYDFHSR